jgi:hypothetical protein
MAEVLKNAKQIRQRRLEEFSFKGVIVKAQILFCFHLYFFITIFGQSGIAFELLL